MMNKVLMVVGVAFAVIFGSCYAFSDELVTLQKKNTVSLREEFTQSSIDTLKSELINISHSLPPDEPIYLFLDTPGGSVMAGRDLLAVMRGIKNPIHVIAHFAASMGYMTTQGTTGKRYVTQDGILMAHRATLGVEGQTPGEIEVRLSFFTSLSTDLAKVAATRTGVSYRVYEEKTHNEYWVAGQHAVDEHQADAVVAVTCGKDLTGTTSETLNSMFGPVDVEWSNCPLITQPISVSLLRASLDSLSPAERFIFEQTIRTALFNKTQLVNDTGLQNSFHSYIH